MTLSLSELQLNFSKALHYKANGDDCDVCSNHFSSDDRIQIYRNNFIISLNEVLCSTYPIVLSLVGQECFDGLARKHILSCPLQEGNVAGYGVDFSETIKSVEQVIAAVPYLADIATLEWAIDDSNQTYNQPAPTPNLYAFDKLQTFNAEQQADICLFLNPALSLIKSNYAVFSIRNAIKNNDFVNLEINQPESGIVLVLSKDELFVVTLNNDEISLLEQVDAKTPLGKINPELVVHLQKLISLNLFIGFQVHI
ncbi:DNA-binding domain-containing protein [Vibrio sp. F74]|uniref:HvfC/BufC N-terminal domain-containing protein n=1 Tax=Vibrio sp. F74 TaxID=700020 RepID=UPI0035F5F3DE